MIGLYVVKVANRPELMKFYRSMLDAVIACGRWNSCGMDSRIVSF